MSDHPLKLSEDKRWRVSCIKIPCFNHKLGMSKQCHRPNRAVRIGLGGAKSRHYPCDGVPPVPLLNGNLPSISDKFDTEPSYEQNQGPPAPRFHFPDRHIDVELPFSSPLVALLYKTNYANVKRRHTAKPYYASLNRSCYDHSGSRFKYRLQCRTGLFGGVCTHFWRLLRS